MRALYRFGKINRLRFVSHLDLQRYMQRALSRTNLPIAYSMGFNPHPVMAFASALAMGWTSEYEVVDIKLALDVEPVFALSELSRALPADLPVYEAKLVPDTHPAQMSLVNMAEYRVTVPEEAAADLRDAVAMFSEAESVTALRKTKTRERMIDLKPLTQNLSMDGCELFARLSLTEADTVKPDLLIAALCEKKHIDVPDIRIHRLTLLGLNARSEEKPLLEL